VIDALASALALVAFIGLCAFIGAMAWRKANPDRMSDARMSDEWLWRNR
jgi:hypothetical protein